MGSWPPIDRDDLKAAASRAGFDTDFPLLIRRLIAETSNGLTALDMPGGSGTAAGGFDGVVAAVGRTIEVPAGTSVWELSVTNNAQSKADDDYGKRLDGPDGLSTGGVTYVQAILAPWTKNRAWASAHREEQRWKEVIALNLDAVHGWLDRAPATTAWLAERLGKAMPGVRLIDQWWSDTWLPSTVPVIGADTVLAGRQDQASALVGHIGSGRRVITLGGDLGGDGLRAFVAASLEIVDGPRGIVLRARAVHVTEPHSLAQLVRQPSSLIIVIDDAQLAADLPAAHAHQLVLVPPPGGACDVHVPPVDAQRVEALLQTSGQSWERAGELGRLARRSLPAMRRALALNVAALTPAWALAPDLLRRRLLLLGAWDGDSDGDRAAVSHCVGRSYEYLHEGALALTQRADYPMLGRVGERWHIMSPEDAWLLLSPHLTKDDLGAFRETALDVLGEQDPLIGMSADEKFRAQIDGARRRYSAALRHGLAQSLTLLGCADRLAATVGMAGGDLAAIVARKLFDDANADSTYATWTSLGDVLTLLAEAAPDEFLRAMRDGLQGNEPPHARMFGDFADDRWGSTASPHTAFLWSLETVAWSSDHFDDAVDVLSRLAALDPGGGLANRPARSLAEMLSVWHPETAADEEQRHRALRRLLRNEPAVARRLLLDLLPDGHGFQTSHPAPRFRTWKQQQTVGRDDLLRRTFHVAELLLDDLHDDPTHYLALIGKVEALPPEHRARFGAELVALADRLEDDNARALLHDALRASTAHHREYADTAWAMPDAELTALESAVEALRPRDPVRRARWLFASDWVELGDQHRRDDFAAYDAELGRRRADAVGELLAVGGMDAVDRLAAGANMPRAVGGALAAAAPGHDPEMLARLVGAEDLAGTAQIEMAGAYFAARLRDSHTGLVDELIALTGDSVARAYVLLAARDPQAAWERLTALPDDVSEQYWKRFSYFGLGGDFPAVLEALRGLAGAGRHAAALDMLSMYAKRADTPEAAEIAATSLEALLSGGMSDAELARLASRDYQRLFALLGRHRDAVGDQRVINLEWQLFPVLGLDADAPTLHTALSKDPAFFAEIVGYAYRPDTDSVAGAKSGTQLDDAQSGTPIDDTDDSAEQDPPLNSERRQEFASRAYRLLRTLRRCPSAESDNCPDQQALQAWTEQARARLADNSRLGPGDSEIGQALAWAEPDKDGRSPPRAVRDLLEIVRSDQLEDGLVIGLANRRGITTRGVYDGGTQELDLVDRYRRAADEATAWPRTRRLLRRLADGYARDAERQDDQAERLRRGLDH